MSNITPNILLSIHLKPINVSKKEKIDTKSNIMVHTPPALETMTLDSPRMIHLISQGIGNLKECMIDMILFSFTLIIFRIVHLSYQALVKIYCLTTLPNCDIKQIGANR